MYAADFQNVAKTYRSFGCAPVTALRAITLSIPSGSAYALLGPNRAGKTTLIKLLLSLARPSSGVVQRLGQPITDRGTLADIGYMHENHAFPKHLSAAEVLYFYGAMTGLASESLPKAVDAVLDRVGLADRRREPIARFSKGMVQRLGLAQAILNVPKLLVLDEPTEGLDLHGRQLLRAVVKETVASGRTVLMVSHTLTEVEVLCDRAAVLRDGSLVWHGTLEELKLRAKGSLESALQALYRPEAA